jgi:hypothetical protein
MQEMQEIQERREVYFLSHGSPVRWRNGALESFSDYENGPFGWYKTTSTTSFLLGRLQVLDPLTGEFVCPPKPERPYDMTTVQMVDALNTDPSLKFESNCRKYQLDGSIHSLRNVVCECRLGHILVSFTDGDLNETARLRFDRKWRKVVADE